MLLLLVAALPSSALGTAHRTAGDNKFCKVCDAWYKKDKELGSEWLKALPSCPCSEAAMKELVEKSKSGAKSDPPYWDLDASPDLAAYHPGAERCYRSRGARSGGGDGTAQQCCFKGDKLITKGFGAGTPDRGAAPRPAWNLVLPWVAASAVMDLARHLLHDVASFEACCKRCNQDDKCVFCQKYFELRPPDKGAADATTGGGACGPDATEKTSNRCADFSSTGKSDFTDKEVQAIESTAAAHPSPQDRASSSNNASSSGYGNSSLLAFRSASATLDNIDTVLNRELELLQGPAGRGSRSRRTLRPRTSTTNAAEPEEDEEV